MVNYLFHILSCCFCCVVLLQFFQSSDTSLFHEEAKYDNDIKRNITWGDLNFLHTTDTHGWYAGHINQKQYDADWGDFISFIAHIRRISTERKVDLLVIDSGDKHDGNGLSDATVPNGAKSLPVFIKADYDLLTIGNHELYELENTKQEIDIVVNHFKDNYVSTNVEFQLPNGTYIPIGQKFKYFSTPFKNIRILAFGFLFAFSRNAQGTKVTPTLKVIREQWFLNILKRYPSEDVDIIIIVAHMPITHDWDELQELHHFLRLHYPSSKIQYFGGHSHIRDFTVLDDALTGLQSGRFCETVGWLSIDLQNNSLFDIEKNLKDIYSRTYIDFSVKSFLHHANISSLQDFQTPSGIAVRREIENVRKKLDLDQIIGYVKYNYYMDNVPLDHPRNIYNLLSNFILPTLRSNETVEETKSNRIIIINTGSVRYDLYKGPYTVNSHFIISPFQNDWVKVTVPKKYALKISSKLNEGGYILNSHNDDQRDNSNLLPPHLRHPRHANFNAAQYSLDLKSFQRVLDSKTFKVFDLINSISTKHNKHTRGYVTVDDFGNDGDDTKHRALRYFPISNVVESVQVDAHSDDESDVDVIFYNFITQNVLWAVRELGYDKDLQNEVEFYSNYYLGLLINDYIKLNEA